MWALTLGLAAVLWAGETPVPAGAPVDRAKRPSTLWSARPSDPGREPMVAVHGLGGNPASFARVAEQVESSRYQLRVFDYPSEARLSTEHAADLAAQIEGLAVELGEGRDLLLLAHSAGGIVARQALNVLDQRGALARFRRVRFIAVDTPWHGYAGPPVPGFLESTIPPGAIQMRDDSPLFRSLYRPLPAHVEIELLFAESGATVFDYSEGPMGGLILNLVHAYGHAAPLEGDTMIQNYWAALREAESFLAFDAELKENARRGELHAVSVRQALERHYPRLRGAHGPVIQLDGPRSFLQHLRKRLAE